MTASTRFAAAGLLALLALRSADAAGFSSASTYSGTTAACSGVTPLVTYSSFTCASTSLFGAKSVRSSCSGANTTTTRYYADAYCGGDASAPVFTQDAADTVAFDTCGSLASDVSVRKTCSSGLFTSR